MDNDIPVIHSQRLDLLSLTPELLQLTLDRDHGAAEQCLRLSIPTDWYQNQGLIELRLQQLQQEPAYQPWSLRAMGLRQTAAMVGFIGFHSLPGAEYLSDIAPHGVEFGYTVFTPFRRQGYAREACAALMNWAFEEQGVAQFVVSISPENIASTKLALGLGYQQAGSHIDDVDGLEIIYRLDFLPTALSAPTGPQNGVSSS